MGENRPEDTLLGGIQKRHLSPGASRGHLGEIKMLSGYWIQIQKKKFLFKYTYRSANNCTQIQI